MNNERRTNAVDAGDVAVAGGALMVLAGMYLIGGWPWVLIVAGMLLLVGGMVRVL